MIDPTFRNSNREFGLSFIAGENDPTRSYFDKYYKPSVESTNFNALLGNKPFFDQHAKKIRSV